jgi:23S rRNA pseudouridine2605 synthase
MGIDIGVLSGQMEERLQKILSSAGIASRRKAETLILEGRVTVNGKIVTRLGTKADPNKDHIKVSGKRVRTSAPRVYGVLNKPARFVTTRNDPEGRPTVMALLGSRGKGVYPVGRLDYDSEGLLVFTNDGDLANALMHPRKAIPKTYLVKVKGVLTDEELLRLERGVRLGNRHTAPAQIKKRGLGDRNSWIEVTLREGRNRQVRKMCEALGHFVLRLRRVRYGPLELRDLALGQYRSLSENEVKLLREACGLLRKQSNP